MRSPPTARPRPTLERISSAFGVPNWEQSAALHFGLAARALDGHFTGYTAANDPVRINGVLSAGVDYILPSYDGAQLAALNPSERISPPPI